jgi:phosphatidyl-N-methylethanolamine N-methyltransferase
MLLFFAILLLALSPALYTWVWRDPSGFCTTLAGPRDPCRVMSAIANVIRTAQFCALVSLVNWSSLSQNSPWVWCVAACLVACGQLLNLSVYALLGHDGVYYGFIFGKKLPRITTWPYSWFSHPQYIGCVATLLGLAPLLPIEVECGRESKRCFLFSSQRTCSSFACSLQVVAFGIATYVYCAVLESAPPGKIS